MVVTLLSTHRIGALEPTLTDLGSGTLYIYERLSARDLVAKAHSAFRQNQQVVAYLPATNEFLIEELADLARTHPALIHYVTCDCGLETKDAIFRMKGVEQEGFVSRCYITKDCGGTMSMAKLAKYIREFGELPPGDYKLYP